MIDSPFSKPSEQIEPEPEKLSEPEKPVVEEVVEEPKPVVEEKEHQKILREYGGMESNIPINHRYWRIRP